MFRIMFAFMLNFSVTPGRILSKDDVKVCYDISGCERHTLTCRATEHIIIEEAYLGYNCSGHLFHPGCKGAQCCHHSEDFQCWDMMDVIPVRSLCNLCWRQARCKPVTTLSPNRCSKGLNIKPVYSVVKYSCETGHGHRHDDQIEDMCREYLIELPNTGSSGSNDEEGNGPERKRNGRGILIGVVITIIALLTALVMILLVLYIRKRTKEKATNKQESVETSSESLPEYHVLETLGKRNSNRMSTYYNSIDDLNLSRQASVVGGNSDQQGKSNSSQNRNRDSDGITDIYAEVKKDNSNIYTNIGDTNLLKGNNTSVKRVVSTVEADAEYSHLRGNQDKRKLTKTKSKNKNIDRLEEDYHHLYEMDDDVCYDNSTNVRRDYYEYDRSQKY